MKNQIILCSILALTVSPFAKAASNVFPDTGKVGIGTTTPQRTLEVVGEAQFSFDSNEGGSIFLVNPRKKGLQADQWALYNMTGPYGDSFQIWSYPASGQPGCCYSRFAIRDDGTTLLTPLGGSVGIGTQDPQAKLHVEGDVLARRVQVFGEDSTGFVLTDSTGERGALGKAGCNGCWSADASVGDVVLRADKGRLLLQNGDQGAGMVFLNNSIGIGTSTPQAKLDVNGNIRCTVLDLTSDRNQKADFTPISPRGILDQLLNVEVTSWIYLGSTNVRHIGPMAQDFMSAFGYGDSDKHISVVDALGVQFAALQGLNQKLEETLKDKDARIAALEKKLAGIEQDFAARFERMEKLVAAANLPKADSTETTASSASASSSQP